MKEFISKYKIAIVIGVLLILFVLFSILVGDNAINKVEMKSNLEEWLTETAEDDYVVTVIAQTTCSHCIQFKPIMQKVVNENDFKIYWFEANTLLDENYEKLTTTYELPNYEGTPYTFITKNGEFVDYISGQRDEKGLTKFLKDNSVIK